MKTGVCRHCDKPVVLVEIGWRHDDAIFTRTCGKGPDYTAAEPLEYAERAKELYDETMELLRCKID